MHYLVICPKRAWPSLPPPNLHPPPRCTHGQCLPSSDLSEASIPALWVPGEGSMAQLGAGSESLQCEASSNLRKK